MASISWSGFICPQGSDERELHLERDRELRDLELDREVELDRERARFFFFFFGLPRTSGMDAAALLIEEEPPGWGTGDFFSVGAGVPEGPEVEPLWARTGPADELLPKSRAGSGRVLSKSPCGGGTCPH